MYVCSLRVSGSDSDATGSSRPPALGSNGPKADLSNGDILLPDPTCPAVPDLFRRPGRSAATVGSEVFFCVMVLLAQALADWYRPVCDRWYLQNQAIRKYRGDLGSCGTVGIGWSICTIRLGQHRILIWVHFSGAVDTRIGALPDPPELLPARPAALCARRLRDTALFFSAALIDRALAAGTHLA